MSKTWLIMRREYLTRVRNKTFLLSTFLLPVVIVLFVAGAIFLAMQGKSRHRVAVVDSNGFYHNFLKNDSTITYDFSPGLDTSNYEQRGCTAILLIPALRDGYPPTYVLKYKKQLGFAAEEDLKEHLRTAVSDRMILEKTGVDRGKLDSIRNASAEMNYSSYEDLGKQAKASNQMSNYIIGYVSGFLIYLLTFIYGAMVMRGVMEEKTTRIAEVVISSVKPFQLMMGKIIGIGAVGLTQFLLWILLLGGLVIVAQGFIPHDTMQQVQQIQQANAMGGASAAQAGEKAALLPKILGGLSMANLWLVIGCFLFYFIGGYLFYSSLFAAVGSAVNEDPQEAQALMLPITMPVVFSFIIMSVAVQDTSGALAVWASIIPFSSPIVMMARIPFGVPLWQLGLSMLCLVLGFLFTVWLAGKIYRTGILMYGKKPTWKMMWKWAFHK